MSPPNGRSGTERVQQTLAALGSEAVVEALPDSTRTAQEAAEAVGLTVAQIVKSLVFRMDDGRAVLVCTSGANRVDTGKLSELMGGPVRQASPDDVRQATGFAIGGVPPVGHPEPLPTLIDRDLMDHDALCAAAGTPHAVFRTTPTELRRLTGGTVTDVREDPTPREPA